jgi:hypothetical protein
MSFLSDIFKGVGDFFTSLFKTPKVTLPTIELPKVKTQAPLPVLKPPKRPARAKGVAEDISQFSTNLTPSIQAILGLSVPNVSPGLLIPGAPKER